MGKIAAAGSAIKNARLPSPGEIKEGYLNSSFHKSLHQPLIVKAKVEKTDVQKARQTMTQVGNIHNIKFMIILFHYCRKKHLCSLEILSQLATFPFQLSENQNKLILMTKKNQSLRCQKIWMT